METVFSRSFVTLTEELARSYVSARYDADDPNAEFWRCKLELFLLSQDESVVKEIEREAVRLIERAYESRKPDIAKLPTERKAAYRRIVQASRQFKATEPSISAPVRLKTDKDAKLLPDHLFVTSQGEFKAALNAWEKPVFDSVRTAPGFLGWLRNYPRKPWSTAYTYNVKGVDTPGYPDFVVFRRAGVHILVDLLEPHQGSDALAKAHGLCRFADKHGDRFGRIEFIRVEGNQIKRLDVNVGSIRLKVLATNVDGALDTLFDE